MATRSVALWNTFYLTTSESDFAGPQDTPIRAMDGSLIAMVPAAFARDFCIEGSGRLRDGRVINYAGHCTNGYVCWMGGSTCYTALDATRYPWGKGVQQRVLVPLRSIAVDPHTIPYGSRVYIPRWNGMTIPAIGGVGGFVHDGCFSADDTGGAITGNHIDIFAGPRAMYRYLESVFPTRTSFAATVDAPQCTGVSMTSGGSSGATGVVLAVLVGTAVYGAYRWSKTQGRR